MKYIITENKMYNTFSSFLTSLGLKDVMSHGNGLDSCYYPVEWFEYDYDEDGYEPHLVYSDTLIMEKITVNGME